MPVSFLTEEQELQVVTGTEPGQAAPAAMWVFCSAADTVGEVAGSALTAYCGGQPSGAVAMSLRPAEIAPVPAALVVHLLR